MKRVTILIATIATIAVLAVPAQAATVYVNADCDWFDVSVFELPEDGARVVLRVDGRTVFFDRDLQGYFTWASPWPTERRNHRVVLWVDGERFVERVRRCAR